MAKKIWTTILAIVVLFILLNFEYAIKIGTAIGSAFSPVFIGVLVALILNSPVKLLEKTILASPKLKKVRRMLSLTITLTVILGIAALAGFLLVPEAISSVQTIIDKLPQLQDKGWGEVFGAQLPKVFTDNLDKILSDITSKLNAVLPQAIQVFKSTLKKISDVLLGLFIGILMVVSKEKLAEGLRRSVIYVSDTQKAQKFMASLAMATDKFSKFLAGQLFEAMIFGVMCFITFSIFKLPFASLATVIMALGNLIPMVGGYVGGVVAFIFIFSASPEKALIFVINILILQQIEQLTTYPIIVGRYVGLSSFWILVSVVVGGGLFGFWGLVLGVPIVAFLHHFFKVMYDIKVAKEPCVDLPNKNDIC